MNRKKDNLLFSSLALAILLGVIFTADSVFATASSASSPTEEVSSSEVGITATQRVSSSLLADSIFGYASDLWDATYNYIVSNFSTWFDVLYDDNPTFYPLIFWTRGGPDVETTPAQPITYEQSPTCEELGTCPPSSSFDYSLSNSGTSYVTKTTGNAFTQNTITKSLAVGATTQSVSLSLSGVPNGVTYSVSNSTCSPTCASVITFTVSPTAANGTYPITVTGSPLNRQTQFNLVISGTPFSVSCVGSPSLALLGQTVTWTATVVGGTPPFTYSWSGTNIPTNPAPSTNPFSLIYNSTGQKIAIARVVGADARVASCDGGVAGGSGGSAGSLYVNFDPTLEEF